MIGCGFKIFGTRHQSVIPTASCSARTKWHPPANLTICRYSSNVRPCGGVLTPSTSEKVRKTNYEHIFDEARNRVRTWEGSHAEAVTVH